MSMYNQQERPVYSVKESSYSKQFLWISKSTCPGAVAPPAATENMPRSGGVWGGVAPPARAAENTPNVSQEAQKIIQKTSKIEPSPPQNRRQNDHKRGCQVILF